MKDLDNKTRKNYQQLLDCVFGASALKIKFKEESNNIFVNSI